MSPPQVFFVIPTSHRFGAPKAAVQEAMNRSLATLISLHVEFGTIAEEQLASLPPSAEALVWPVPFCPEDETVAAMLQFVRDGGALYLSGDVSYDPFRRRTRTDRLAELCGVEFVAERYPALSRPAAPQGGVRPASTSSLAAALCADGPAAPCIEVRPVWAEVLAWTGGIPGATLAQVGRGRVLYAIDPLELHTEPRTTLSAFLQEAGVQRHALEPDLAEIHSHRVPGEDGALAQVLFNLTDSRQTVTVGDLPVAAELELAPKSGGAVIFDGAGRVIAVEGLTLRLEGRDLVQADSTISLVSLSGRDLREADQLLLLPSRPGDVALSGPRFEGLWAAAGEVRDRKWVEYERLRLHQRAGSGRLALDQTLAHSRIVLGDQGRLRAMGAKVATEHL